MFIRKSLVCFLAQKPIPKQGEKKVNSTKMRGEDFRALREYPAKCFAYRHSSNWLMQRGSRVVHENLATQSSVPTTVSEKIQLMSQFFKSPLRV